MKTLRILFTGVLLLAVIGLQAQNSMLKNPATGDVIGNKIIQGFTLASNGTDVVLVAQFRNGGQLAVIDLQDNDRTERSANLVSDSIPNYFDKITQATGNTVGRLYNIEVNPISGSVYVLYANPNNTSTFLVVAKNKGNDISMVDLSNVSYSLVTFGTGNPIVQGVAYGGGRLFVSTGMPFSGLQGDIAVLSEPFENGASFTNRNTTMFKTNWGGGYHTDAPLEKFDFVEVNGNDRLVGVTVCAPGFSFDPAEINGTGVLQVDEQFNVNQSPPIKVIAVDHDGTKYLYNLHPQGFNPGENQLMRIGEKWIDGVTPAANNKLNANVQRLRDFMGNRQAGLTDADLKIEPKYYAMVANYDDHNFLVVSPGNTLKMLKVGTKDPDVDPTNPNEPQSVSNYAGNLVGINVYPNPASDFIQINLDASLNLDQVNLELFDMGGKKVVETSLMGSVENKVDITELNPGKYLIQMSAKTGEPVYRSIVIKN